MTPPDLTLLPWLEANAALVGIALAVITIVAGLMARFATSGLLDEVKDTASRPILIKLYTESRGAGYRRAVGFVLEKADRFYGEKLISTESITRSLQLAYAYPVLALLFGWVVFNAGIIGGLQLLPETLDILGRIWRTALLIVGYIYLRSIFSKFDSAIAPITRIVSIISDKLDNRIGTQFFYKIRSSRIARLFAVPLVSTAFVGLMLVFAIGLGNDLGLDFGLAIVSILIIVVGIGTRALIFSVILVIGLVTFGSGDQQILSVTILFYTILPLLNGFADAASVAATRKLLPHIRDDHPSFWRIAAHSFVDLCIALICLFLLLGSLWGVLWTWETLAPNTLAFDWCGYWNTVTAGDLGQATILIFMVCTTLIPTIIHLGFGLAGFWASNSNGYRRAVTALSAASGDLPQVTANDITRHIRRGIFWGWLRAIITMTVGCIVIWQIALLVLRLAS